MNFTAEVMNVGNLTLSTLNSKELPLLWNEPQLISVEVIHIWLGLAMWIDVWRYRGEDEVVLDCPKPGLLDFMSYLGVVVLFTVQHG